MNDKQHVGTLLREWRRRRRLSQLALAVEADISSRHLSFLETGRAAPSRDMLLRLAEQLNVPLREQNVLLVAAGFAPVFAQRALDAPELEAARQAVDLVLRGHEPYPALALDRHWNMVAANRMVAPLIAGVAAELLRPPVNVLRLSLHPEGLAPHIVNYAQWRAHLTARLREQVEVSADPELEALLREITAYPVAAPAAREPLRAHPGAPVVVPLKLQTEHGVLAFISTTTIFGTPVDVTVAELAIESYFPADAATSAAMRRMAEQDAPQAEASPAATATSHKNRTTAQPENR